MTRRGWAGGLALLEFLAAQPAAARSGVEVAADVLQLALPAAGLGVALGTRDTEGAGQLLVSGGASLVTTEILKVGIDAQRPRGGGGQSFPSGHAAAAFAGASFLARRYGLRVGLPALGAASFVAWSRVHTHDHHVEDVVAGAGISMLSAWLLVQPLPDGLVVLPGAGDGWLGVTLGGRF